MFCSILDDGTASQDLDPLLPHVKKEPHRITCQKTAMWRLILIDPIAAGGVCCYLPDGKQSCNERAQAA
jgi:hypothetical protein